LTECSDLSEVEAEETEMVGVAVKMVEAIETAVVVTVKMAVVTVNAAATLRTAETVEET
jgi:hypothetical protein